MFDRLEMAPPDAILGLTEAFRKDPRPEKINLGVGVYKDERNQTPVLRCVKKAEQVLLEKEDTKNYLSIGGDPAFGKAVEQIVFGDDLAASGRIRTVHTPGGTGALRVAADFLFRCFGSKKIWMSDPTWANHPAVFQAAGHTVAKYPYYDPDRKDIRWNAFIDTLRAIPREDVVLLHGCCHNPSGMDLTPAQWSEVAHIAADRGWLPLIDFAYQGLADGLEEDAAGVRALVGTLPEALVCASFSKNFGLYRERCGALSMIAANAHATERVFSQVEKAIRANYSNPPAHGGLIVTTVLNTPDLRDLWVSEVAAMRDRIHTMRQLFVETLAAKGVEQDFSFISRQKGMFSFSGLTPEHVQRLREEYAIYIVGSGRINVAGMTPDNMDRLCEAIASVLKTTA
ncbi:MAG TPA: amino acid aminotransferase [Candidatus Hydrogenedentes bacterium]|nr:amino acid aminotransferase [Candidatus Hydrogenedentota bacterium]HOK88699.1 amino acid aminotransferase [Candidatus Hydrogenedentota bacterium]